MSRRRKRSHGSRRGISGLASLLLVLAVVALWTYFSGPTTGSGEGDGGSPSSSAIAVSGGFASGDPGTARATLEELPISEPGSMAGYSREKFDHWSQASEFGWGAPEESCDVRDAALIRDGEDVVVGDGCKIVSGTWLDPYTTNTYTDPQDIDIDHIVPLANAWRSGASSWDSAEREAYANAPNVLFAVEDNANQEKGDKGPEAWRPPNEEIWCEYAVRWIGIKSDYGLSVNPEEKNALTEMLDTCEGG